MPVISVSVVPSSASLSLLGEVQLTASIDFSGTGSVPPLYWETGSNGSIITLSTGGLVTANLFDGVTVVTASCGGQNGFSTITVGSGSASGSGSNGGGSGSNSGSVTVLSVAITPSSASMHKSSHLQLSASVHVSGSGSTPPITWSATNYIVNVSNTGYVSSYTTLGTDVVFASCGGVSASCPITVVKN